MNKLQGESSPYLLQHADNPVNWFPWGDEVLEKAKQEDKPIFLSIGYAACHWCHVMAHESFENHDTAMIMNDYFINIKVDREERPDIDNIYMAAVVAMVGQGGWPLSVFLTPDGNPFYGGTYFPPTHRYNLPSFKEVLLSIAKIWKEDRQKVKDSSIKILEHIKKSSAGNIHTTVLSNKSLEVALQSLKQSYDWDHGGWGRAPKFPQPMALEFLLRHASHGDKLSLDICTHALNSMVKGGMYDVVGGGFSRYSTDDDWIVPHFEKMLYDNALLSQVYLYAYLLTGDVLYRRICEKTLDFVLNELSDTQGGFYSSLDADSEGQEGKFYIWSLDEIKTILNNETDMEFFSFAYGISEDGNFEGNNILHRRLDDQILSDRFNVNIEEVNKRLERLHEMLLSARSKRVRPSTDDKVITSWNALMMISFAEAGRYLDRKDYIDAAKKNAIFILENMFQNGILYRSWRNGRFNHFAYLEDYGALILGLIALYQTDPNPRWFTEAYRFLTILRMHFRHPEFGFYDTRDDHEQLIFRPRNLQDNAVPSGNALAAHALLFMAAYTGQGILRTEVENMLESMQMEATRYPLGFTKWLSAYDLALNPIVEVAIVGNLKETNTIALRAALWSKFRPHIIAAQDDYPPQEGSPQLLLNRPLKASMPTAYVCLNFTCQQPVNTPEELIAQLK